MKKKIYLIGYSEELVVLSKKSKIKLAGIIDLKKRNSFKGIPVFEEDKKNLQKYNINQVIISIDNPIKRKKISDYYLKNKIKLASLFIKKLDSSCSSKDGLVIQDDCFISTNCHFGESVRINVGSTIMHDVLIGNYVTIAPRAVLLGRVKIKNFVYIGANSTILPDINIGNNVTIGAGAVVTKNIPSNTIAKGIPAKIYKK